MLNFLLDFLMVLFVGMAMQAALLGTLAAFGVLTLSPLSQNIACIVCLLVALMLFVLKRIYHA